MAIDKVVRGCRRTGLHLKQISCDGWKCYNIYLGLATYLKVKTGLGVAAGNLY
jgi:hypothetical protein